MQVYTIRKHRVLALFSILFVIIISFTLFMIHREKRLFDFDIPNDYELTLEHLEEVLPFKKSKIPTIMLSNDIQVVKLQQQALQKEPGKSRHLSFGSIKKTKKNKADYRNSVTSQKENNLKIVPGHQILEKYKAEYVNSDIINIKDGSELKSKSTYITNNEDEDNEQYNDKEEIVDNSPDDEEDEDYYDDDDDEEDGRNREFQEGDFDNPPREPVILNPQLLSSISIEVPHQRNYTITTTIKPLAKDLTMLNFPKPHPQPDSLEDTKNIINERRLQGKSELPSDKDKLLNSKSYQNKLHIKSIPKTVPIMVSFSQLHRPNPLHLPFLNPIVWPPLLDIPSDSNKSIVSTFGFNIVENEIYWSELLEKKTPQGFADEFVAQFLKKVRRLKVTNVEPPTWNRCGRPKNQFLTMSDSSHMCARYRAPHDYLVQGEVMSFYLARLLGIDNIPVSVLSKVDPSLPQWNSSNMSAAFQTAEWKTNTTVVLIQWIDGLQRDRMPDMILRALESGESISVKTSNLMSLEIWKLIELLQWSDLILFDYITGNYDRVASMQDAADKETKPSILTETIHNLVKSQSTRCLWLIDNESGLLDGYSLMYSNNQNHQGQRFVGFHHSMLNTMCVFRRSTVERLKWLHQKGQAMDVFLEFIQKNEPLFKELPDVTKNVEFVQYFQERIQHVHDHIRDCQMKAYS